MGSMLVKPCKQAEIDFYDTITSHPGFQTYVPTYYGTLALNPSPSQPTSSTHAPSHVPIQQKPDIPIVKKLVKASSVHSRSNSQNGNISNPTVAADNWIPSGGAAIVAENNIVLENVADGFGHPNILDVKLGRRLWADDAPPAKRQKLDKQTEETTSGTLAFRIAGMKTWLGKVAKPDSEDVNGYRKYDPSYGRALTVETVRQGFEAYFFTNSAGVTSELARKVVLRFLDDLRGLQEVLQNEESRMYSASLLFVYEGDGDSLKQKLEAATLPVSAEKSQSTTTLRNHNDETDATGTKEADTEESDGTSDESDEDLPKVQALKMIDFAHARWTPGQGPDENILSGIRNVIKVLEELVS